MAFMQGKRVLIVGLANNRSIAYGIAQALHREGAELAFTYQGERLEGRVRKLAESFGSPLCVPMDVAEDAQIESAFSTLSKHWDRLDGLVHSVAFAPKEELEGSFTENTSREGFRIAHDISSYSLTALARAARPMMREHGGSIVTLSYLGAVRAIANYNVMGLAKASLEANVRYLAGELGAEGIRVNAVSAGPIKTLAAAGIAGFRRMLSHVESQTPLQRTVTIDDVGNAAAFLLSELAAGITAEILYVDAGYSTVGMKLQET
jgi:enoyl-[acyl-carrier protein] reductase I